MGDTKKPIPTKRRATTQAEKERLICDMIRDAIADLTKARLILAEGGWNDNTDLLTAMTLTNFGELNAKYARQWMWEIARGKGVNRIDLQLVRSAPELRDARPGQSGDEGQAEQVTMTYQTREELIELLVAASNLSEKLKGRANREFYEAMDTEMLRNLVTILGDEWPPEGSMPDTDGS